MPKIFYMYYVSCLFFGKKFVVYRYMGVSLLAAGLTIIISSFFRASGDVVDSRTIGWIGDSMCSYGGRGCWRRGRAEG